MLKIASKFAMDIFPSVIATILGAYIVNHYIISKPDAPTAAAVSSAAPKKADLKSDAKPAEKSADLGNAPEPGVKAKPFVEKSVVEKPVVEKPVVEKPVEKPADKADRPAETASIPADTRRHPANPREKAVAKTVPVQPMVPAVEPVVATPNTTPPVEAAIAPDRDANDLARAAIERLRGMPGGSPRAPEAARLPDPPRVVAAPAPAAPSSVPLPSVQPLPPPIMVSTPPAETFDAQTKPSYPVTARGDDPRRPTPPADIPDPRPLDLRADAVAPKPREHTNVAEDVLSAAKSMFHSVLPHNSAKEADQDSQGPNRF
jgi:hypothetical protein